MARSFERINYRLRPAKVIERKMMAEAMRRLAQFGAVRSYRYIGFGSTYFSDFILFHKALGITNLISIEKEEEKKARFEFNRPYGCIDLMFGNAGEVLPTLNWEARSILWLDYDDPLSSQILSDVAFACAKVAPGSLIVVSVNAEPGRSNRLATLKERVSEGKVPGDLEERDLAGWRMAGICRRIITNEIREAVAVRNGGLDAGSKLKFRQLFNLEYSDSAKMLTVGGLMHDEGQQAQFNACGFEDLDFIRTGDEAYRILVPNLTYREIRYLDSCLPVSESSELKLDEVPDRDLRAYSEVYRYFPAFVEAEL